MAKCKQCGKELPKSWSTDVCLECSRANVKKIFKENPEVKQAYQESLEEMKKPENIEKMSNSFSKFIDVILKLREK